METQPAGETAYSPDLELPETTAPYLVALPALEEDSEPSGPLSMLTEREAQVATCAAEGKTYKEIGSILNIRLTTVRTHMRNIYEKLELTAKEQLAFVMPVSTLEDTRDEGIGRLRGRRREIFEYVGFGMSIKQSAHKTGLDPSTIRTHHSAIRRQLGGLKNQTELTRIARAYAERMVGTTTVLQSETTIILAGIKRIGEDRYKIKDQYLLTQLHEKDLITEHMLHSHTVGLQGLVAARLMHRPHTRNLLDNPGVEDIAREVIKKEVEHFSSRHD